MFKEKSRTSLTVYDRFPRLKEIPKEGFPEHLLIIPDGNRRYASGLFMPSIVGHKKGTEVLQEILRDSKDLPINIVTIWGFSSDNWKRPQEEINTLMDLFEKAIKNNLKEFLRNKTKFVHLGRKDRIPASLRKTLEDAENLTAGNPGQILCLAIDFGGMDQTVRMIELARTLPKETEITPQTVIGLRDCQGTIPPADLIIRTSGERRTSDIGWLNGANTELYFIDEHFPQISTAKLVDALCDFSKRQRRQGA